MRCYKKLKTANVTHLAQCSADSSWLVSNVICCYLTGTDSVREGTVGLYFLLKLLFNKMDLGFMTDGWATLEYSTKVALKNSL